MYERDLRIDLVKFMATLMVIILHTIENTERGGHNNVCTFSEHLESHCF